jgi:hypothetical protein
MTKTPPILRNSALSIPLGVIAGAFMSWPDAGSALVSSLVVIGNMWVLSVLSPRALEALARSAEGEAGGDVALWMGAIAAKFVLLLLLYLAMLQFLPPFGLAMGFVPMLVGVLITGIQLALAESNKQAESDREQ